MNRFSRKNILITGLPGVGKTTLIMKLVQKLGRLNPVGFYTSEIRERGIRKGFELVSLKGARQILSSVDIKSQFRVGKYGVDIAGFDEFLDTIDFLDPSYGLTIIDEIGKMECLSDKFRKIVSEILDSSRPAIFVIALKGNGIIAEIKRRQDIQLLEITMANRERLMADILQVIADMERP
jgi:nucleoside-triphosphatase